MGIQRERCPLFRAHSRFLEHLTLEQLELFVRAVTGNKILSAGNLGPERLPVAHTCFNSIELSADYECQEKFDAKLQMLLSAVQGGSGFSLT